MQTKWKMGIKKGVGGRWSFSFPTKMIMSVGDPSIMSIVLHLMEATLHFTDNTHI